MRTLPLSASASVVLTGGDGSCSIGPTSQGETWPPGYVVGVYCSTNNAEAICQVFVGGQFIGSTTWGSTGDSTSDTTNVAVGQTITAQWTGGDPGATAYLNVTGTRQVG